MDDRRVVEGVSPAGELACSADFSQHYYVEAESVEPTEVGTTKSMDVPLVVQTLGWI